MKLISSLAIVFLGIGIAATATSTAKAQDKPHCYIINESGELTDLSSMCGSFTVIPEGENESRQSINSQIDFKTFRFSLEEDLPKKTINTTTEESNTSPR
ncbi:MAG: hypothetical protein AB4038_15965 [Prochloraceae cyanobacterium]